MRFLPPNEFFPPYNGIFFLQNAFLVPPNQVFDTKPMFFP